MSTQRKLPMFDVTPRERCLLVCVTCLMAVLSVVGAAYYYVQWQTSTANPVASYSQRKLVDEKIPLNFITAMPLIYSRRASKCHGEKPFEIAFGWYDSSEWIKAYAKGDWQLVNGYWIAKAKVPFQWYYNSTGEHVRFEAWAQTGEQCWDHGTAKWIQCPSVRGPPHYAFFDDLGIECDSMPFRQIKDSGVALHFHTADRNLTDELVNAHADAGMDPVTFMLTTFPAGAIYRFQPQDLHNFAFKLKASETIHPDGAKEMRLSSTAQRIPFSAGEKYNSGGRHYFTVAVDPSVTVCHEQIQMDAIAALTAYATSATTLLSLFGLLFSTKVTVPYHFAWGDRPNKYRANIVFGDEEEMQAGLLNLTPREQPPTEALNSPHLNG